MHCENVIEMAGSLERIYELAANIQDWPALLPHYRYVRVLEQSERHKVAAMGARRGWFPVSWRARQDLLPEQHRIRFRHLGGVSRGMEVEWRLVPASHRVRVTITHDLNYPIPLLGPLFAHYIVGELFVKPIANMTLRRIKEIVEGEAKQAG
ncbi:MAG: hypothetical protein D6736_19080 [Nitrospinota bacterium]|nr:MAG: hypothetical protein D6736_19080 [Nitrospinota bacterium]